MPIQIDAKSIVDLVAKEGWHLQKTNNQYPL